MGAEYCAHPTEKCFYEGGEDDEGEWENYWCAECNRYLTQPQVEAIRERPEWDSWQTER